ncbi:hypothetical protein H2200_007114 [Cladophialophora chaetospira]|uniref:Uncharacterized protein n=1 Tax=Cladophialophora chaetospira TaxID=386627 RepID=A0AA39CGT4_9EURO|nr:hypothetical protein H2200_007114 [Cladophialophora chaetospira]
MALWNSFRSALTLIRTVVRKRQRRIGEIGRLGSRVVKLQIVPQLTRWNCPAEEPKVVLYQNRGVALLSLLVHLAPFAGVLTLLNLNINGCFIGSLSTSAVTAFQFTAKLLELLMQASLSVVLIDAIHWQIVKNQDLPLGGLVAPLQATHVSYLWSLEFWGCLTAKDWRIYRKLYLGLLIFATVVVLALVGPAGAVAMLPRQINYSNGSSLYIMDSAAQLFRQQPSYLDDGAKLEAYLPQLNTQYETGTFKVFDTDGARILGLLGDIGLPSMAATLPSRDQSGVLRFQGRHVSGDFSSPSTVLAMRSQQALVQATCQHKYLDDHTDNGTHLAFPGIDARLNRTITWGQALESITQDGDFLVLTNLPSSSPPPRNSALLAYGSDYEELASVTTCVIDAAWADVMLNVTASDAYTLVSYTFETRYDGSIPQDEIIDFPPAWTDKLGSMILNSSTMINFLNSGIPVFSSTPQILFALLLANSNPLSDVAQNAQVLFRDNPDPQALHRYLDQIHAWGRYADIIMDVHDAEILSTDPSSLTFQTISRIQQGYGYNASGITVQLSLTVLGIYCLFVITHSVFLLSTGYAGPSRYSIAELLMLGVMSRKPEHLGKHACAGLDAMKAFREPVSVKVNDEGSPELVFGNDLAGRIGRSGLVEANKAY